MRQLREVSTVCPSCMRRVRGRLLQKDDCVALTRECGRDGPAEMAISRNPGLYADWDRFYFSVLKRGVPRGRILNYWVVCTSACQLQCSYCHADVQDAFAQEMSGDELADIVGGRGRAKMTLSGGEPTLHPDIFRILRAASHLRRPVQLATNGVMLADAGFCRRLREAGLKEVRISFELLDRDVPPDSEFAPWRTAKLRALENLGRERFHVSLSPTIFKGINEHVLRESLEYARERPFVKNISVNGFSWVGHGTSRDPAEMIMPDEMMDIICREYDIRDRESAFTFQKALFTLLQLLNIRMCIYTQVMVFVRKKGRLEPFLNSLHMGRMKKAMRRWEKASGAPYAVQLFLFCIAMAYSMKLKTLLMLKDILKMMAGTVLGMDLSRYPSGLLPVILNTNCSALTADEAVSAQCMSGVFVKRGGVLSRSISAHALIEKEIEKHAERTRRAGRAASLSA